MTNDEQRDQVLIQHAVAARQMAYAPYSKFAVGAALLCHDGTIYRGCNIENASYGATICAERVAAGTAIAAGQSTWEAIAIATAGGASPCGLCRQFLIEFAPQLTIVLFDTLNAQHRIVNLSELFPDRFQGSDIIAENN